MCVRTEQRYQRDTVTVKITVQYRRAMKGTIYGRWDQGHREGETGHEGEGLVCVDRNVSASRQEQQFGEFSKDPED